MTALLATFKCFTLGNSHNKTSMTLKTQPFLLSESTSKFQENSVSKKVELKL